uniref:Uncharacterized protein n=1 Tax=Anguilla anguilla TaxID=7936 RepID=A0A0E9UX34_ANGAN
MAQMKQDIRTTYNTNANEFTIITLGEIKCHKCNRPDKKSKMNLHLSSPQRNTERPHTYSRSNHTRAGSKTSRPQAHKI